MCLCGDEGDAELRVRVFICSRPSWYYFPVALMSIAPTLPQSWAIEISRSLRFTAYIGHVSRGTLQGKLDSPRNIEQWSQRWSSYGLQIRAGPAFSKQMVFFFSFLHADREAAVIPEMKSHRWDPPLPASVSTETSHGCQDAAQKLVKLFICTRTFE